mgnify:CR=1 FL=1
MTLRDVKDRLLAIQHGAFEPDWYLSKWFNPEGARYYVANAVEVIPTSIRWGVGKACQCHLNSLSYALQHPGSVAWFGMQYLEWAPVAGLPVEPTWEVHSIAVEPDGTVIDSGEYQPRVTRYVMVPWDWQLHDLLAQKETT